MTPQKKDQPSPDTNFEYPMEWPVDNETYHADETHTSSSHLKEIIRSPEHYKAVHIDKMVTPKEPTKAMMIGSVLHGIVLEDKMPGDMAVAKPEDLNKGKGARARAAEFREQAAQNNQYILDPQDFIDIGVMTGSLRRNPMAKRLLWHDERVCERPYVWIDEVSGVKCKAKPDLVCPGISQPVAMCDLKTADDPSPFAFGDAASGLMYDVSAVHYMDGYAKLTGIDLDDVEFLFITVGTSPPWATHIYRMPDPVLKVARSMHREALDTLAACRLTGVWEDLSYGTVEPLRWPSFRRRRRRF